LTGYLEGVILCLGVINHKGGMGMRFVNHREFAEWQLNNDIESFLSNYDVWPNNHVEFVGVDRFGKCYLIEHYRPAEYLVHPISDTEALASLALSWRKSEFRKLLEERREIANILKGGRGNERTQSTGEGRNRYSKH
jgi:hypothetical protein